MRLRVDVCACVRVCVKTQGEKERQAGSRENKAGMEMEAMKWQEREWRRTREIHQIYRGPWLAYEFFPENVVRCISPNAFLCLSSALPVESYISQLGFGLAANFMSPVTKLSIRIAISSQRNRGHGNVKIEHNNLVENRAKPAERYYVRSSG